MSHNIVVVGGVAGGMSAAARLRRLDESAHITVLERGPYVSFANCGLPYYVSGEIAEESDLLLQTPQSLHDSLNLDVRVHHAVTAIDADAHKLLVTSPDGTQEVSYDALILTPGALPARLPIPGINHRCVHTLRSVDDAIALRAQAQLGGSAVILGAGFIGLEASEALANQGLDVHVVEYAPQVLPPLEKELAWLVAKEMDRLAIKVKVKVAASSITDHDGRAVVALSDGTTIKADIVVVAVGTAADTAVFEAAGLACERGYILIDERGRTNLADVYAAGDATVSVDAITGVQRSVQLAGPANRAGRLVADAIGSRSGRAIPKPLSSAIVRVGSLTAAMTGANRASLDRAGIDYVSIHTHPGSHAGYFPGAKTMHLITHIDPVTGRILGAQGVGEDGIDKRIDILATAIRGGLSAPDLIDLDLCYSPPYGSAKDAVNMIGMVAENVLTGQTRLWYAEQIDWACGDDVLLLDVRSATEFESGHVTGAINIPHTELRSRLDEVRELAAGRWIAVMCHSGVRSYIGHRILKSAGFESSSLSGGILTLQAWMGQVSH